MSSGELKRAKREVRRQVLAARDALGREELDATRRLLRVLVARDVEVREVLPATRLAVQRLEALERIVVQRGELEDALERARAAVGVLELLGVRRRDGEELCDPRLGVLEHRRAALHDGDDVVPREVVAVDELEARQRVEVAQVDVEGRAVGVRRVRGLFSVAKTDFVSPAFAIRPALTATA